MNFKSLVLGLAAAVSLVSSAKALVMNGDFTLSSYPSGTPYEDIVNIPRQPRFFQPPLLTTHVYASRV